jgi:signal transduction histidine kinase
VLTNLLDNAIKYSPDGGRIEVEAAAGSGEVCLTVRDHGVGIPPEERERVFERFYRAHAGRPGAAGAVAGGMGIGLYLTRQIVELHGGRVRADAPGDGAGGTSVVVTLPAGPTGERPGRDAEERDARAGPDKRGGDSEAPLATGAGARR